LDVDTIFGDLRHECLHQRVVRNNIFRKTPPSVVSGYGKRSKNLNTKREGDFIYLRSRDNSAVNKLISDLKNIYHFVKQFGNQVKLVFLQLPIYSISSLWIKFIIRINHNFASMLSG
jgi:hypothetical protein